MLTRFGVACSLTRYCSLSLSYVMLSINSVCVPFVRPSVFRSLFNNKVSLSQVSPLFRVSADLLTIGVVSRIHRGVSTVKLASVAQSQVTPKLVQLAS